MLAMSVVSPLGTVAAARANGAATSRLAHPAGAALRSSRRAERALGRRLSCRAEQGDNGHGKGENGNGNGNGNGEAGNGVFDNMVKSAEKAGLSMGPISLSFQAASPIALTLTGDLVKDREFAEDEPGSDRPVVRLSSLTTEEWQKKHIREDGTIDLWLEEEYNAASRMPAGREYGSRENVAWSGKEASDPDVAVHSIRITNKNSDEVINVTSPADRYVLFEAEEQGLDLPSACRMGCCTVCAVKVKSGTITQPQALGLSAGMKAKGYALLCVGFAQSDLEVELQDPDEVYDMQFGQAFDELATDKGSRAVLRDDFALELATGDE